MVSILGKIIGCGDKEDVRLTVTGWTTLIAIAWLIVGVCLLVSHGLADAMRLFWEMTFISRVSAVFILPAMALLACDIWALCLFDFNMYEKYEVGDRDE